MQFSACSLSSGFIEFLGSLCLVFIKFGIFLPLFLQFLSLLCSSHCPWSLSTSIRGRLSHPIPLSASFFFVFVFSLCFIWDTCFVIFKVTRLFRNVHSPVQHTCRLRHARLSPFAGFSIFLLSMVMPSSAFLNICCMFIAISLSLKLCQLFLFCLHFVFFPSHCFSACSGRGEGG